jgi:hypothetical protein
MAARLFTAQTWVTIACGLLLLMTSRGKKARARPLRPGRRAPWFSSWAGCCWHLLVEFAVAPRIVARENLKLWHAVGSGMYLLQWLCAGAVLWKASRSG